MSEQPIKRPRGPLVEAAHIRPVRIDEMSDVRYLHGEAVKKLAAAQLSEVETKAFADYIYSDRYTSRLADAVRAGRLLALCLGTSGQIVATAGWVPANDAGATVRLIGVFVSPLFAHHGLGRMAVEHAQAQARQAGFSNCSVRCPVGAAEFFVGLGFEIASHGVWGVDPAVNIPVAFMRKLAA